MSKESLRNRIIRLAQENPGPLRDALLPLLDDARVARVVVAWERKSVEIPLSSGTTLEAIPALVTGVWAVHKSVEGDKWSVTHVPTGLAASSRIATKAEAKHIVEMFARVEPALMTARTQSDVMRFSTTLVDIMRNPSGYP